MTNITPSLAPGPIVPVTFPVDKMDALTLFQEAVSYYDEIPSVSTLREEFLTAFDTNGDGELNEADYQRVLQGNASLYGPLDVTSRIRNSRGVPTSFINAMDQAFDFDGDGILTGNDNRLVNAPFLEAGALHIEALEGADQGNYTGFMENMLTLQNLGLQLDVDTIYALDVTGDTIFDQQDVNLVAQGGFTDFREMGRRLLLSREELDAKVQEIRFTFDGSDADERFTVSDLDEHLSAPSNSYRGDLQPPPRPPGPPEPPDVELSAGGFARFMHALLNSNINALNGLDRRDLNTLEHELRSLEANASGDIQAHYTNALNFVTTMQNEFDAFRGNGFAINDQKLFKGIGIQQYGESTVDFTDGLQIDSEIRALQAAVSQTADTEMLTLLESMRNGADLNDDTNIGSLEWALFVSGNS